MPISDIILMPYGVLTSSVEGIGEVSVLGSSTRGSLGYRSLCLQAFAVKLASQPPFLGLPLPLSLACL